MVKATCYATELTEQCGKGLKGRDYSLKARINQFFSVRLLYSRDCNMASRRGRRSLHRLMFNFNVDKSAP